MELLGGLLLDEGKPTVHLVEERSFLGPGSQSVSAGWREGVSLDDLDRWVAGAIRRGQADKAPIPGKLGNALGDKYSDLLARVFTARYAAPASEAPARHMLPIVGTPARSPPPEPARLGCGTTPLDLLWPDLVRAFRVSPQHDRWDALPGVVGNRLRGPEAAPPCS